ncbi:MAG TPA: hypothetical protein VK866_15230, partial [Acidimicrobiales bacterium]|nr:hypothetical protein [Acidimicrobiales bacterium]
MGRRRRVHVGQGELGQLEHAGQRAGSRDEQTVEGDVVLRVIGAVDAHSGEQRRLGAGPVLHGEQQSHLDLVGRRRCIREAAVGEDGGGDDVEVDVAGVVGEGEADS